MYRFTLAALVMVLASQPALAETPSGPAIIRTDASGTHTLLQCSTNEMPVYTEGATVEVIDGKKVESPNGVSECVAITESVRDTDAGGSASLSWDDGRQVGVAHCPAGTVPFALDVENYTLTIDPSKPMPHYFVAAPVLVRCMETADLGAH